MSERSYLEEISIRSLGIIDQSTLELGKGLNVLTGETGAGKTMILTALSLVLGGKSDSSLVRHGSERLVATAQFSITKDSKDQLDEIGAEVEGSVGRLRVDEISGNREQRATFEIIADYRIIVTGRRSDVGVERDSVLAAEDGGGIVRQSQWVARRKRSAEGEDGSVRNGDTGGRANPVRGESEIAAGGGDAAGERVRGGGVQDPGAAVRLLQIENRGVRSRAVRQNCVELVGFRTRTAKVQRNDASGAITANRISEGRRRPNQRPRTIGDQAIGSVGCLIR